MLLIKNGFIISNNALVKKDILIKNDKILKIEDEINEEAEIIDAKGLLVMPGAVDVHVHFREPGFTYKENISSGSKAAAKGGFTDVMTMPNLNPCPNDLKTWQEEQRLIVENGVINIYPYMTISEDELGEKISDFDNLHNYCYAASDDGHGVNNLVLLEEACKLALKYNMVIASHAETKEGRQLPCGEYDAVRREIEIAKRVGCRYHFCHLSTKESFEAVRQAKKEGYRNITCEAAPHHLVLNSSMIKDANWKMNPPLRGEDDRLETVRALVDGTVDVIATDHAPHAVSEKSKPYSECPNGIIGIETSLPIIYTNFVKTGVISLDRFLDLMVYNPINVFSLPKHGMYVGSTASLTALDITNLHTYLGREILSLSQNCPYIGEKYYGFPKFTICNGKIVYHN